MKLRRQTSRLGAKLRGHARDRDLRSRSLACLVYAEPATDTSIRICRHQSPQRATACHATRALSVSDADSFRGLASSCGSFCLRRHNLKKDLAVTHHVQLVWRALFDCLTSLAQTRYFRSKLRVARIQRAVDTALSDQLSIQIPDAQPAPLAEP